MKKFILIFLSLFFLCFIYSLPVRLSGYSLAQPDESFILPSALHEISGLTEIDSVTFGCVQDELGIIYIYHARSNKIIRQFTFGTEGDYEGITRAGKNIYVLRSDGALAEILDFDGNQKINYYDSGVPIRNNEGLCYDEMNNRLLIGCKSKPEGIENRDHRLIYSFDLKNKILNKLPAFDLSVTEIVKYASENKIQLPLKTRKKGKVVITEPVLRLSTSEIAIHPVTKQLYLLSAADKMLLVFDMKGKIKHIEMLDPILFNKAEGITFFKNGDMLITNEGQDRSPTLHRFNYRPDK